MFVAPSPLAAPALARPAAGFLLRRRPLLPLDAPAGFASQSGSRCRVVRRPPYITFAAGGGAVGDAFVVEGATNVKFSRELTVPGYAEPLVILGTGYRDKFFVKVYAAAFYMDNSIGIDTEQWREKVGIETFDAPSVFDSIFKAPVVKSLNIALVRDVDGKTFVKALAQSQTGNTHLFDLVGTLKNADLDFDRPRFIPSRRRDEISHCELRSLRWLLW